MLYGIGINDVIGASTKNGSYSNRVYNVWFRMIRRCYSPTYHKERPSYIDCEVCDKWKRLSGFMEDIDKIPGYERWMNEEERIELDKDIRGCGAKLYSLETCSFVSRSENTAEKNVRNLSVPIICTNEAGEETVYPSIKEASRDGFVLSCIQRCLTGEVKQHHKCKFRYA